jgi:hypothetical protein
MRSYVGKLSGGFVVSMRSNRIITESITAEKQKKMEKACEAKLEKIKACELARKEGKIETSSILTQFYCAQAQNILLIRSQTFSQSILA